MKNNTRELYLYICFTYIGNSVFAMYCHIKLLLRIDMSGRVFGFLSRMRYPPCRIVHNAKRIIRDSWECEQ